MSLQEMQELQSSDVGRSSRTENTVKLPQDGASASSEAFMKVEGLLRLWEGDVFGF